MSHPFDATLKEIVGQSAADFAPVLHLPIHLPARTLNVDLSTVSAATDVAFGFGNPLQEIVDVNFQSGPDAHADARLHLYNAAYHHHHHVSVRTILILLRPAADHSRLSGQLTYAAGGCRVEFQYEIIRMWQQPLTPYLTGGLGLLPLATLCQLPPETPVEQALREVVHQIDLRLATEALHSRAVQLMTAAFVLTGLRVARATLDDIFRGVRVMHESSAFELYEEKGRQIGLQEGRVEGRVEECQRVLLRQGAKRFGVPSAETKAAIESIQDLERLERLVDAVLTAQAWQELLETP